jgi:hypothetical protein
MYLLKRNQIDENLWNKCVENALNSRIYGLTWYLDSVCEEWRGLTDEHYSFVFPIPISRKWRLIPWVAQPPFCQQLGIFSSQTIDYKPIFKKLSKYIKVHLCFTPSLQLSYLPQKRNSLLCLHYPYEHLFANFNSLRKRELKYAKKQNWYYSLNEGWENKLDFWLSQWKKKTFFQKKWEHYLFRLVKNAYHAKKLHFLSIHQEEKIIGVGLFLLDFDRIIYLGGTAMEKGVTTLIFDLVIRQFAFQVKYLDFEGSSISGVQKFYESFGSLEYEFYPFYEKSCFNLF